MKVNGTPYRTIWREAETGAVTLIDQTRLPFEFVHKKLASVEDAAEAIFVMRVRGAPLIGATAAYGMAIAADADPSDAGLEAAYQTLIKTRPTAINLKWALDEMMTALKPLAEDARAEAAYLRAAEICDADVEACRRIGLNGLGLIQDIAAEKAGPVNVLTHCNAGWLATVDWGTATSPIYHAHEAGIDLHVWVDETRPRNQGASLTAWELHGHGVPHTVIVDNVGGHLMLRSAAGKRSDPTASPDLETCRRYTRKGRAAAPTLRLQAVPQSPAGTRQVRSKLSLHWPRRYA